MTDSNIFGSSRDDTRCGQLRKCPHCDRKILWRNLAGLHTQSWHYGDSIIEQCVISTLVREEIPSPDIDPTQRCGYCQGVLTESSFH